MKRIILFIAIISFFGFKGFSQVLDNSIGLRIGAAGLFNSVEVSYQKGLNKTNRIEIDFGFGTGNHNVPYGDGIHFSGNRNSVYSALMVTGAYHWNMNIIDNLNWYIGPAANVSLLSYNKHNSYNYTYIGSQHKSVFDIGAGVQAGIEYDFNHLNVPILVSIDLRPMIQLQALTQVEIGMFYNSGLALSGRYTF